MLFTLADMRAIVASSFRSGTRSSGIYRRPFALDEAMRGQPSRFEVDDERVLGEYAYYYPRGRQALVFDRTSEHCGFSTVKRMIPTPPTKKPRWSLPTRFA